MSLTHVLANNDKGKVQALVIKIATQVSVTLAYGNVFQLERKERIAKANTT